MIIYFRSKEKRLIPQLKEVYKSLIGDNSNDTLDMISKYHKKYSFTIDKNTKFKRHKNFIRCFNGNKVFSFNLFDDDAYLYYYHKKYIDIDMIYSDETYEVEISYSGGLKLLEKITELYDLQQIKKKSLQILNK